MGAFPEEIEGVIHLLSGCAQQTIGMRTYYSGQIKDVPVVAVFSRWGKVAAATTVSTLIERYGITELIFTGVAGALHTDLRVGDIVLGKRLIQHDMDARPLMKRFEIPLLGKTFFDADHIQLKRAESSINALLDEKVLHQTFTTEVLDKFAIVHPKLFIGDIASGDQFFSSNEQKIALHAALPSMLCVEMEGAAVAQVCFEHQVPFTIIRTISDLAEDNAHIDFPLFSSEVASRYSIEIIKNILDEIKKSKE